MHLNAYVTSYFTSNKEIYTIKHALKLMKFHINLIYKFY